MNPPERDESFIDAITIDRRSEFAHLRARIALTYQYLGAGVVLMRALTFPLRFTPLRDRLPRGERPEMRRIRRWYRANGRRVTVVIPSYRDAAELEDLVRTIRGTTRRDMVDIIVADDASGAEHLDRIRRIKGITVIAGEQNTGPAGNINRAISVADPSHDVVILNSDMKVRRHWLAALQYGSQTADD
ncbi:MAG: glycosyltransferase family 2 protein, partial [Solirubrobacteraceae bacterium]